MGDERGLLVVNFKTYPEGSGARAVALAELCERAATSSGVQIIVCPPMVDLARVAHHVKIPVFAQHVDPVPAGSTTGHSPLEAVASAGAKGTLLNHAEHRLRLSEISALIEAVRRAGLQSIVCADTLATSRACAAMGPDFVAIEPPELIGGEVSVTTARPEVVQGTVEAIRSINPKVRVLCGAGVRTGADVATALRLGTIGVLLASGVVLAKEPRAALADLLSGFA